MSENRKEILKTRKEILVLYLIGIFLSIALIFCLFTLINLIEAEEEINELNIITYQNIELIEKEYSCEIECSNYLKYHNDEQLVVSCEIGCLLMLAELKN